MNIVYIEPLRIKMASLLGDGEGSILNKSQALFGSEEDIASLCRTIETSFARLGRNALLVDMTPLLALGTQSRLQKLLDLTASIPFFVAANQDVIAQHPLLFKNVSVVVTDDHHRIVSTYVTQRWRRKLAVVADRDLPKGACLKSLHDKWVNVVLVQSAKEAIRLPSIGTKFLRLHEGAWANLWIDVKRIIADPEMAFFIAYQIGYALSDGYSKPLKADALIVGNNTAYCLATLVHRIFDTIGLVMIDRLGPIARLPEAFLLGLDQINRKRLCMIEDVISTGREIDLMQMLIYLQNATLFNVVCLFDLEISRPRLVSTKCIVSLCRPAKEIHYKRLPAYNQE